MVQVKEGLLAVQRLVDSNHPKARAHMLGMAAERMALALEKVCVWVCVRAHIGLSMRGFVLVWDCSQK